MLTRGLAVVLALACLAAAPVAGQDARIVAVGVRETGQPAERVAAVLGAARRAARDEADVPWMMAHGIVESDLRASVESCEVRGTRGEVGLWQSLGGWTGAGCPSLSWQARTAAARVAWCRRAGRDLAACWGGLRVERRRALAAEMGR